MSSQIIETPSRIVAAGDRTAWTAVLRALVIGGLRDLYALSIYPHGLPKLPAPADGYRGLGWPTLVGGLAIWALALDYSFGSLFRRSSSVSTASPDRESADGWRVVGSRPAIEAHADLPRRAPSPPRAVTRGRLLSPFEARGAETMRRVNGCVHVPFVCLEAAEEGGARA